MAIQIYNCPSCGSPNVKIMENLTYISCEYCLTRFQLEQRNGHVLLTYVDQMMRQVVNDTAYNAACTRLQNIDDDIDEAQKFVEQKQQIITDENSNIEAWHKKRLDKENAVLMGNGVLIFAAFLLWYLVIFKLEGDAWFFWALVAIGVSLLIFLLYGVYTINHKSLPEEYNSKLASLEPAKQNLIQAQLQLNDLIIEKELCLHRKKNYHVRAAPAN